MVRTLAAVGAVAVAAMTSTAWADEDQGRRLLGEALEAREQGRLLQAKRLLERSLEAHRWTYPAFELANVLSEMGRPHDALRIYDALGQGEYGEVTGPALEELQAARSEARADVAVITLRWGDSKKVRIRLDGELVAEPDGIDETVLETNPGPHIVIFERAGKRSVERHVELAPSERASITVDLASEGAPRAHLRARSDPDVTLRVPGHGEAAGELKLDLSPGTYPLIASVEGEERRKDIRLTPGERLDLVLDRPGKSRMGWLWGTVGLVAVGAVATVLGIVLGGGGGSSLPVDDVGT